MALNNPIENHFPNTLTRMINFFALDTPSPKPIAIPQEAKLYKGLRRRSLFSQIIYWNAFTERSLYIGAVVHDESARDSPSTHRRIEETFQWIVEARPHWNPSSNFRLLRLMQISNLPAFSAGQKKEGWDLRLLLWWCSSSGSRFVGDSYFAI